MFPMVRGWSYVESCISVAPSWSLGHGVDERGDSWGSVVVSSRLATIIERLDWFTMFTIVVEYGNQAKSPYTCSCLVHVRTCRPQSTYMYLFTEMLYGWQKGCEQMCVCVCVWAYGVSVVLVEWVVWERHCLSQLLHTHTHTSSNDGQPLKPSPINRPLVW